MSEYYFARDALYSAVADGDAFIVSKMDSVPSSGTANVHLKNPHEDKVMWLGAISISTEGSVDYYVHDSFDSVTDGSNIIIQNALMDSGGGAPDSGPFEAYSDSSFTVTGSEATIPIGFSVGSGVSQNTIDVFPAALEPGREFIIELQNQDTTSRKSLISVLLITSY